MPQVSLYLDAATLKKVTLAAQNQQVSISKWVAEQVRSKVNDAYPKDFAQLFGAISDDTFAAPPPLAASDDARRESL